MRAVIDTNVLVSALLTPSGVPARLILAIRSRELIPVISPDILAEYAEVLNRSRFSFAKDRVVGWLDDMEGLAIFLRPQAVSFRDLPDADDALLLPLRLPQIVLLSLAIANIFPHQLV